MSFLVKVLAGDLIQFPKKFEKSGEPKKGEDLDWGDSEALNRLLENETDPKRKAYIKEKFKQGSSNEPYVGKDIHSLQYSQHKPDKDAAHQMPSHVKDLQGTLGKDVPIGGPDPFAWMDTKYKVSLKLLEKHKNQPLQINTRSDLIGHDDYIEAMNPQKHTINIHVMTTDSSLLRTLEPGAPSWARRLKAIQKLVEFGFRNVFVVLDKLENDNLSPQFSKKMASEMEVKRKLPSGVKVKVNRVKITDKQAEYINSLFSEDEAAG